MNVDHLQHLVVLGEVKKLIVSPYFSAQHCNHYFTSLCHFTHILNISCTLFHGKKENLGNSV